MFSEWIFGADLLPTWALFAELIFCGLLVIITGARLTHLADALSDKLNLGKAWVGLLLLAGITSLPELVTGSTAVIIGEPDLAFGNIFGSCMFNVAIIVLLNGLLPGGSILKGANLSHSLSSAFGIVLMSIAVLGFSLVQQLAGKDATGTVSSSAAYFEGFYCLVIAATYLSCMRLNYRFERQLQENSQLSTSESAYDGPAHLYSKFTALAAVLITLTIWLTKTGDVLQDHPLEFLGGKTLGGTFVGAFFLAVATSLPEIVTCVTAVRIGQLNLALGNIFGSNMFNIFVIPLLKIVSVLKGDQLLMYGEKFSILSHSITGLLAILITAVALASLTYRTKRRFLRLGFDSVLIGLIYLIGMYLVLRV